MTIPFGRLPGVLGAFAASAIATLAPLAQAGTFNLPVHGGSAGSSFTLDCGDDKVLVGVGGRRGMWLDAIQARCVKLAADGTWSGSVTTTSISGGRGGSGFSVTCPQDKAISAITGTYGSYLHRLQLNCVPIGTLGSASTITVSGSVAGSRSFSWETCPNSKPARGIHGRSGIYVDAVGMRCHADGTPRLQAAATPLAAPQFTNPPSSSSPVGSAIVTIRWTGISGAQSYRLSIRESNSSQWLVSQLLTASSYGFNAADAGMRGGKVTAVVAACRQANGTDCSPWSERSFLIQGQPVVLSQPASGATYAGADRRPTFSWQSYAGFRPSSGGGPLLYRLSVWGTGASPQTFSNITSTSYQLPQAIDPGFANPVRWSVTACITFNCSSPAPSRTLNVTGGAVQAGSLPQVSFAQHLYPTIASTSCAVCHPSSGTSVIYPQRLQSNASSCGVGAAPAIPFSTSQSAATMLARLRCLRATSQSGVYAQALGKVYVVPGQSAQSGLHYKAQSSTSAVFGSSVTIGGVTKPLREWITIWIDQGANP